MFVVWGCLLSLCSMLIYATATKYLEYGVVVTISSQGNTQMSVTPFLNSRSIPSFVGPRAKKGAGI